MRARVAAHLSACFACAACTTIVRPPAPSADDVEVLVIAEAWHGGLVLPEGGGTRVEWGYGQFDWYARGANAWHDVFHALFWPARGTLSRREWGASESAARADGSIAALRAPRSCVEALSARPEAQFARSSDERVWNEAWRTAFVPDERDYWLFHNCHDATAHWLAELGCVVEPALVRAGVRVRETCAASAVRATGD